MLTVHLLSEDRRIRQLCQEALGDILGRGWGLHVGDGSEVERGADLYIWDVDTSTFDPGSIRPADLWRHLFVAHRYSVPTLRERLSSADARILLKPVTRAALSLALSETCNLVRQRAQSIDQGEHFQDSVVTGLQADRDEMLQCLIQTNLKLQEYDSARTKFLARAIHDFRAPLTAITGYCGLLLGEDVGPLSDGQREVLERMHHSALKLSRMASAMFQLSISPRIEQTLDLQRGEIRDCIEQALHDMLPTFEEKRISVSVEAAQSPEPLFFESSRVEQVLVNLLDNACKFVPRGGTVEVRGYPCFWDRRSGSTTAPDINVNRRERDDQSQNSYRIDVRDNGPGVPPSCLPTIFEEYTSYSGGSDRSGGGLGLAICRMIMTQHKGKIWAESSSAGAVFSLVLPFHRPESSFAGASVSYTAAAGARCD